MQRCNDTTVRPVDTVDVVYSMFQVFNSDLSVEIPKFHYIIIQQSNSTWSELS